MNEEHADASGRRLRWRCRRAMLELDLIFSRFVDGPRYRSLDRQARSSFERLLDESDSDIWLWIQGAKPTPKEFELIIRNIV